VPRPAAEVAEQARVLRVWGSSLTWAVGWRYGDLARVGKGGGVKREAVGGGGMAEVAVGEWGGEATLGAAGHGWRRQAGPPARKKKRAEGGTVRARWGRGRRLEYSGPAQLGVRHLVRTTQGGV
jgi:hypothetical protein